MEPLEPVCAFGTARVPTAAGPGGVGPARRRVPGRHAEQTATSSRASRAGHVTTRPVASANTSPETSRGHDDTRQSPRRLPSTKHSAATRANAELHV